MAIPHSNRTTDNTAHAAKLFLDSEPEINKPATALRLCPWWYKKELLNCCTRRKTKLFFSSSPSVNNLQQFFFCAVKGGVRLSHHKIFTFFNVQKYLFVFSYVIWHYLDLTALAFLYLYTKSCGKKFDSFISYNW